MLLARNVVAILTASLTLFALTSLTTSAAPTSTITVTTTTDIVKADGKCSLREAIQAANTNAAVNECAAGSTGTDNIVFGVGAGTPSIGVKGSALPTITAAVNILGNTGGATRIELNGTNAGASAHGLTISAQNVTVRALVINRFGANGIEIRTLRANKVFGSFIGTDAAGTGDLGNGGSGIHINSSTNNQVGRTTAADRNIISGNTGDGVLIDDALGSQVPSNNVVSGNYIGTNVTGNGAIPNDVGVYLDDGTGNVVGGTSGTTPGGACTGACNVISGNGYGVALLVDSSSVRGNFIGTDVNGTAALPNTLDGVLVGGESNTIGSTSAQGRNLISGNTRYGLRITGSQSQQNAVQGNFIGTNTTGMGAVGNGSSGINIRTQATTIGGTTAGERNLISGNLGNGIELDDHSLNNTVQGNFIGTLVTGFGRISNGENGIEFGGSSQNTIGGTTGTTPGGDCTGACNVITGNTLNGIHISNGSHNLIQGNMIGINVDGASTGGGNTESGISIQPFGRDNTIGGTSANARNVISANGGNGIEMIGSLARQNLVQGNYIGTDKTGMFPFLNGGNGIEIQSPDNTIGGTEAGARNVISYNDEHGIKFSGADATGNKVLGNYVGVAADGTGDAGNGNNGVNFSNGGASGNQIGGAFGALTPADGNVIAFNDNVGVGVEGADNNSIRFNSIHSNAGGIELFGSGNNSQPAPVLTAAMTGSTIIQGSVSGAANKPFAVDFYHSPSCGTAQGKTYLGSEDVITNGGGTVLFNSHQGASAPLGSFITATVTDENNNTSEFSNCVTVVVGPTATPNPCTDKPDKPDLTAPAEGAAVNKSRPTFKWTQAQCADTYNLYVKYLSNGHNAYKKTGLTGLQNKPPADHALAAHTSYKWFVKACNTHGCNKSLTRHFSRP